MTLCYLCKKPQVSYKRRVRVAHIRCENELRDELMLMRFEIRMQSKPYPTILLDNDIRYAYEMGRRTDNQARKKYI